MKSKHSYFLVLFLVVFITRANAQQIELNNDIRVLLNSYEIALSSKSAANVADCFHSDAVILPEGKHPVKGKKEIIENFKGLETIEFVENFTVEEVINAGDYLIVQTKNIGSWKNLKTSEGGNFEVKGQMILKPNEAGDLKIYRYMYNGNGSE